jgi:mannose-6-phosphate isomerase-like protein (cupin superfamily)
MVSAAVRHRTVVEVWYVLAGRGEIWRGSGSKDETVEVEHATALTIPVGTRFQVRTSGESALELMIGTFPRWPGAHEAEKVEGRWAVAHA